MSQDLHVGHEFLLLYLDDERGTGALSSTHLGFSYAGALVAHWMFTGALVSTSANQFRLRDRTAAWPSLQVAEGCLPDKDLTLPKILTRLFGWDPSNRYTPALTELTERGLVERQRDRFFGIPWRTRWPTIDGQVESQLITRLRDHAATYGAGPPHVDDALLGLLRATNLLGSVWTEAELTTVRPSIVRCTERVTLGRDVTKAFTSYEAAVSVAAM